MQKLCMLRLLASGLPKVNAYMAVWKPSHFSVWFACLLSPLPAPPTCPQIHMHSIMRIPPTAVHAKSLAAVGCAPAGVLLMLASSSAHSGFTRASRDQSNIKWSQQVCTAERRAAGAAHPLHSEAAAGSACWRIASENTRRCFSIRSGCYGGQGGGPAENDSSCKHTCLANVDNTDHPPPHHPKPQPPPHPGHAHQHCPPSPPGYST